MLEVITEAVVLDKTDAGELDSRIHLYTKDFGKVSAKAKSLRKITSKLAGHLEPANRVMARIVEKNGVQVIDALTMQKQPLGADFLKALFLVKELAAEWQPDDELWDFLAGESENRNVKSVSKVLELLGYAPAFAKCNYCQAERPETFFTQDFHFYCQKCSPPGVYNIN